VGTEAPKIKANKIEKQDTPETEKVTREKETNKCGQKAEDTERSVADRSRGSTENEM
jgi:hypothetical protein